MPQTLEIPSEMSTEIEEPSEKEILTFSKKSDTNSQTSNGFLSKEDEYELVRQYQEDNSEAALEKLLKNHDAFCKQQGYFFAERTGIEFDDLHQEARMGLMESIKRFDTSYGTKLLTYAGWWIHQHVQSYIAKHKTTQTNKVNLPPSLQKILTRYNALMKEYIDKNPHKSPSDAEEAIEEELGVSINRVKEIHTTRHMSASSLDVPIDKYNDSNTTHLNMLEANTPDLFNAAATKSDARYIKRLLDATKLTKRERQVIKTRYLQAGDEITNRENIGKTMGVSRERIRQIEKKALKKLFRTAVTSSDPTIATHELDNGCKVRLLTQALV